MWSKALNKIERKDLRKSYREIFLMGSKCPILPTAGIRPPSSSLAFMKWSVFFVEDQLFYVLFEKMYR